MYFGSYTYFMGLQNGDSIQAEVEKRRFEDLPFYLVDVLER